METFPSWGGVESHIGIDLRIAVLDALAEIPSATPQRNVPFGRRGDCGGRTINERLSVRFSAYRVAERAGDPPRVRRFSSGSQPQRALHERLLLRLMPVMRPCGRCGGEGASDVGQVLVRG